MKAVVYPDAGGEWRWHLRAGNGEIIAHGESYVRRIDAEDAVRLLFGAPSVDVEIRGHHEEITHNYKLVPPPAAWADRSDTDIDDEGEEVEAP